MRNKEWCKHFNGIQNDTCRARVVYSTTRDTTREKQYPCMGTFDGCPMYEPHTEQEIADRESAMKKVLDAMRAGVSSCCNAPEDRSRVITEGKFKGHGSRHCSKCGNLLYMV